jgi:hypothetical protein
MEYNIIREGHTEREATYDTYSRDDALNTFADELERADVPAFYHQDSDGTGYILAAGERYDAVPA